MKPFVYVTILAIMGGGVVMQGDGVALDLLLKPTRNADGVVEALEVREQVLSGLPEKGSPFSVSAPLALYGARSVADSVEQLQVSDAQGPVPLTANDGSRLQGEDVPYRHWLATRPVVAPLTIRYRIRTQAISEGGPPIGMKASGHGVAGNGISFLVLPDRLVSRASRLRWDLSDLPKGSIGVATSGEGDTLVPGAPAALRNEWMLAGPAGIYASSRIAGFKVYALGTPPYDERRMFDWVDRSYAVLSAAMPHLGEPGYRLFFRALEQPAYATGMAREGGGGSLVTVGSEFGHGQTLEDLENYVFHEMTHQWVGQFSSAAPWFSEGLTTYLAAVLPCREGLFSAEACAAAVNGFAGDYYRSRGRNWPLERIAAEGGDESVRRVPYGRGLLYFALLDSELRLSSFGRHGLLDVVNPLLRSRQQGIRLSDVVWETMLRRELGEAAVREFRRFVLEGSATVVPPSASFGPCLLRVEASWIIEGKPVTGYQWRPRPCANSVKGEAS